MTPAQFELPLQEMACVRCALNIAGRCEGAITSGSVYLRDPSVIGCDDANNILRHLTDLIDRKRLPKQPSRHSLISIPPFIPVLAPGMPRETDVPEFDLYGVSLATILTDSGNVKYRSAQALRRNLRLSPEAKIALLGGCNDNKLNRAWTLSRDRDIWRRIADLQFTFVTSFSYSVYDSDPRSDQIINQMKNLLTYEYFCSLGIPCIPFIFFNPLSPLDFEAVIEWLKYRPDITRIAMLGQSYIQEAEFDRLLQEMRRLSSALDRAIEFLIVGAGAAGKLRTLASEFPTAAVTVEWPVVAGLRGIRILPNLKEERVPKEEATHAELIRSNILQFSSSLNKIRQTCINPLNILPPSLHNNFGYI